MLTCTTLKQGRPCIFMKKSGCSYNGGQCHTIVATCQGCEHVGVFATGSFCNLFAEPDLKWNGAPCNMASHVRNGVDQEVAAKKVNPLKASKRTRK